MFFVYILQSLKDLGFYIGVTSDINRRFTEHNSGLSKSTKSRIPFIIVRVEKYLDIKTAYKREYFLKSKKNSKIIKKIVMSPDAPTPDASVGAAGVGIPISPLANIGS
ncbi:MAG: GIY-YIG nuclease family protein [Candidatus Komeilibacteria bacterium]|nr:GIY-YIG nuclease family protein [Candidatus Komeilibacteria bacterium]